MNQPGGEATTSDPRPVATPAATGRSHHRARRLQQQGGRRLQPRGEQPRERRRAHDTRGENAARLGVSTAASQSSHTQEHDCGLQPMAALQQHAEATDLQSRPGAVESQVAVGHGEATASGRAGCGKETNSGLFGLQEMQKNLDVSCRRRKRCRRILSRGWPERITRVPPRCTNC